MTKLKKLQQELIEQIAKLEGNFPLPKTMRLILRFPRLIPAADFYVDCDENSTDETNSVFVDLPAVGTHKEPMAFYAAVRACVLETIDQGLFHFESDEQLAWLKPEVESKVEPSKHYLPAFVSFEGNDHTKPTSVRVQGMITVIHEGKRLFFGCLDDEQLGTPKATMFTHEELEVQKDVRCVAFWYKGYIYSSYGRLCMEAALNFILRNPGSVMCFIEAAHDSSD